MNSMQRRDAQHDTNSSCSFYTCNENLIDRQIWYTSNIVSVLCKCVQHMSTLPSRLRCRVFELQLDAKLPLICSTQHTINPYRSPVFSLLRNLLHVRDEPIFLHKSSSSSALFTHPQYSYMYCTCTHTLTQYVVKVVSKLFRCSMDFKLLQLELLCTVQSTVYRLQKSPLHNRRSCGRLENRSVDERTKSVQTTKFRLDLLRCIKMLCVYTDGRTDWRRRVGARMHNRYSFWNRRCTFSYLISSHRTFRTLHVLHCVTVLYCAVQYVIFVRDLSLVELSCASGSVRPHLKLGATDVSRTSPIWSLWM